MAFRHVGLLVPQRCDPPPIGSWSAVARRTPGTDTLTERGCESVTIAVRTSGGWTFEAQLEEDEFQMLWLVQRHSRTGKRRMWSCFKHGCRSVTATPAEQVLLDAHGFGSGRIQ